MPVGTQQFSAAGNDYEYFRERETVSTTGPLVNSLTVQVCICLMVVKYIMYVRSLIP